VKVDRCERPSPSSLAAAAAAAARQRSEAHRRYKSIKSLRPRVAAGAHSEGGQVQAALTKQPSSSSSREKVRAKTQSRQALQRPHIVVSKPGSRLLRIGDC
jgi:hypothetical protein